MPNPPLERLARADERLRERHGELASLCPGRASATPLHELGERALSNGVHPEVAVAFAEGLERVAESQSRHFPDNIFWDLDYPAACLFAEGTEAGVSPVEGARRIDRAARLVESLESSYGCDSVIRFRYVHDFVYGFDWARWVAAEPVGRSKVGPFDRPFLEYLLRRGEELVELVESGDERYGPLVGGENRNPFRFAREPEEEARLHRDLADRRLIPVEAWRYDAEPRWDRPYGEARDERAAQLGLVKEP